MVNLYGLWLGRVPEDIESELELTWWTVSQIKQEEPTFQQGAKLVTSEPAPQQSKTTLASQPVAPPTPVGDLDDKWKCPKCGSKRVVEETDKSKILYMAAWRPIYSKKHRCLECSTEWSP